MLSTVPVQFKMVSRCFGKPLCVPSHLSDVYPALPSKCCNQCSQPRSQKDQLLRTSVCTATSNSLINALDCDAKGIGHVFQSETTVGLKQLSVGHDSHLAHVVTVVGRHQSVILHQFLHLRCQQTSFSVKSAVHRPVSL